MDLNSSDSIRTFLLALGPVLAHDRIEVLVWRGWVLNLTSNGDVATVSATPVFPFTLCPLHKG